MGNVYFETRKETECEDGI